MLTDRQRKWLRNLAIGVCAFLMYAGFVWAYFQFERFGSGRADITFGQAVWYVVLNPTGLGSTTTKLFPSTLAGRVIGVVFALTSIGFLRVFVGKVSDMFHEIRQQAHLGRRATDETDHVVILGWDDYSRRVARELGRSEIDVVVVTADKSEISPIREAFDDLAGEHVEPVYADYDNYGALDRFANISEASRVFLNRDADTDTLISLFNVESAFQEADLSFIVRVRNERLLDRFDLEHKDIDVTPVWTFGVATALIASFIYEPEVAALGRDFVSAGETGEDYELQQYRVGASAPFAGETYNAAFEWFFDRGVYLVGMVDASEGDRRLDLLLDGDQGGDRRLEAEDYVVVALEGTMIEAMERWTGHSKGLKSLAADDEG